MSGLSAAERAAQSLARPPAVVTPPVLLFEDIPMVNFNMWGQCTRDQNKAAVHRVISETKPSIVCLQEADWVEHNVLSMIFGSQDLLAGPPEEQMHLNAERWEYVGHKEAGVLYDSIKFEPQWDSVPETKQNRKRKQKYTLKLDCKSTDIEVSVPYMGKARGRLSMLEDRATAVLLQRKSSSRSPTDPPAYSLLVVSYHGPNNSAKHEVKKEWTKALFQWICSLQQHLSMITPGEPWIPVVVGGDFNYPLYSWPVHPNQQAALLQLDIQLNVRTPRRSSTIDYLFTCSSTSLALPWPVCRLQQLKAANLIDLVQKQIDELRAGQPNPYGAGIQQAKGLNLSNHDPLVAQLRISFQCRRDGCQIPVKEHKQRCQLCRHGLCGEEEAVTYSCSTCQLEGVCRSCMLHSSCFVCQDETQQPYCCVSCEVRGAPGYHRDTTDCCEKWICARHRREVHTCDKCNQGVCDACMTEPHCLSCQGLDSFVCADCAEADLSECDACAQLFCTSHLKAYRLGQEGVCEGCQEEPEQEEQKEDGAPARL